MAKVKSRQRSKARMEDEPQFMKKIMEEKSNERLKARIKDKPELMKKMAE